MNKDVLSQEELNALLGHSGQPPSDDVSDGVDLHVLLKTVDELRETVRHMARKIEGLEAQLQENKERNQTTEEDEAVQAESAVTLENPRGPAPPVITMSRKERHKKEKKSWF